MSKKEISNSAIYATPDGELKVKLLSSPSNEWVGSYYSTIRLGAKFIEVKEHGEKEGQFPHFSSERTITHINSVSSTKVSIEKYDDNSLWDVELLNNSLQPIHKWSFKEEPDAIVLYNNLMNWIFNQEVMQPTEDGQKDTATAS